VARVMAQTDKAEAATSMTNLTATKTGRDTMAHAPGNSEACLSDPFHLSVSATANATSTKR